MSNIDIMFIHSVDVEPFLGSGPTGSTYGPKVTLSGLLDDGLIEESAPGGGSQLASRTTFFTDLANASSVPVNSRVTVADGRRMTVTGTRLRDGGWLLGAVTHLEVDVR